MNTKKLLSSTILYGFGDVIVLAVGSFLLMPLYTRILPQADYGIYLITKTNIDIMTYIMHFGLISAVGRLYFVYQKKNEHYAYLSSVLIFYLFVAAIMCITMLFCGPYLWHLLSPSIPAYPYIWFCLAIVGFSFFPSLTSIWLRVEDKVSLFVVVQISAAILLLAIVMYNLLVLHNGLVGVLYALAINALCMSIVLPVLLWRKFSLKFNFEYIRETLRYAVPIVFGYCAYFVLNRISMVILQRYVPVEQVAIFGLGQQLAVIVTLASSAFAKSLQPVIFSADLQDLGKVVDKSGRLYLLLMSCLANIAILFASDILRIAAPAKYSDGYYVFLILIIANLLYSASFIADTVLLYFRHPMTSVMITTFGGILSLSTNLILIPQYKVYGAAFSILLAFSGVLAVGLFVTRKLVLHSNLKSLVYLLPLTALVTVFAVWLRSYGCTLVVSIGINSVLSMILLYMTHSVYSRLTELKS
jgi:O-antigen/teichoic acid export membrane protein